MQRTTFGFFLLAAAVLAGGAWGGVRWYRWQATPALASCTTAPVTRGEVRATIDATGTVEPEEVVDVGAQVAGAILAFGKDANGKPIDYGSEVAAGTVLAQIDDSLYAADVAQARAQVEQANAALARAEADLGQLQARFDQAERDWARAEKLGPSDALAQVDYDAYRSAFAVSKANVAVGTAAIAQARGAAAQAQASLERAQRNLSYCTIKAPVQGVIIDRRVNIGQTVVASLNAPSLFLIAKDLKRMQVWVAVNEADIGSIRAGQPVSFTVDAHPGRAFTGQVNKVRLNASMTQNVVTYTVEVVTDNSSGRLLPYLTAAATFEIDRRQDVLLAPNAALRFTPRLERIAPDARAAWSAARTRGSKARAPADGAEPSARHGTVWTDEGEFLRPHDVELGLSDGVVTELRGDAPPEGTALVTGETTGGDAAATTEAANPFTPQYNRGRGGSGGTTGGGAPRAQ